MDQVEYLAQSLNLVYNAMNKRKEPEKKMENPQIDSLIAVSDKLLKYRRLKEELETALAETRRLIEQAETDMLANMEQVSIDKFAHAGKLFYPIVASYPKILDQDKFYSWLEDHGEDGIIKRTVHPQTLRTWYKDASLLHGEELVGQRMIHAFERVKVGVRSSK